MSSLFAIGLGIQEAWPILLVVFLLFGAKRLPEMARSMGQGVKEFRKGIREATEDLDNDKPAERAESEAPEAASKS